MMSGFGSLLHWIRQKFADLANLPHRLIGMGHDLWTVLMPCRFSVLMMLVVALFFLYAGQGRDTLREFVESWSYEPTYLVQQAFFLIAALAWASSCWYFARLMLSFQFVTSPSLPEAAKDQEGPCGPADETREPEDSLETGDDPFFGEPDTPAAKETQRTDRIVGYCVWVPRILGTSCLALVSFAHLAAAFPYGQAADPATRVRLFILAGFYLVLAGLFFLVTWRRRAWLRKVYPRLWQFVEESARLMRGLVQLLDATPMAEERFFHRNRVKELRNQDKVWITCYGALAVVLFVGFVVWPVRLGQFFGTSTILLFAAGGWIVFGTLMVYLGSRYQVPALTLMLAAAVVFSFWNDNHGMRTLESNDKSSIEGRPMLAERFDRWLETMDARYGNLVEHPFIVVAAEGGGIRAAYWTAAVLTELQDRNEDFARHVFALSAVSGGSLGSAVFAALVAEQADDGRSLAVPGKPSGQTSMSAGAREMLEQDFLGPVVGKLLYPDLFQRFLPWPFSCFDRALALEEAWEDAWATAVSAEGNRFKKGFLDLWPQSDPVRVPALFLNATWVEGGKRIIVSNVRTAYEIPDAVDFLEVSGRDLPLSTAVHASSRFTYVSPAGTLKQRDADGAEQTWGHVVDGGYFENSGAATAYDILWLLSKERAEAWRRIKPVIVSITNNPKEPRPWGDDPTASKPTPTGWLGEISSPVRALLASREARGTYSQAAVETLPAKAFFRFGLCDEKVPLPLGWQLSRCACTEMTGQLKAGCGDWNNVHEIERLSALIPKSR